MRRWRDQEDRANRPDAEKAAIARILIAFSRLAIGEYHFVTREFDVPVRYAIDVRLLDGAAVDEITGRDEHLAQHVKAHAMPGRKNEIGAWTPLTERAGDQDWAVGQAARLGSEIDRALPDPFDRTRRAIRCDNLVTDAQRLDGHLSGRRADQRTACEAGDGRPRNGRGHGTVYVISVGTELNIICLSGNGRKNPL